MTATVCDKTMAIALGQARGQRVKIRDSRLSGCGSTRPGRR
ncbi:hypothetical protein Rhow_008756 [Rhodococcus wratislaviensis]|uniref:Uncharacterized protein n=1 Tax=Rhodococcus wratislaviensis TaxID=44752 RepID=A0A402CLB7_RHOWR|nr:hypothetical protein Rhow_008756 [Rhodococcus wratislaviensis]